MVDVLILVVNYRTPQLVVQCLHSLRSEIEGRDARVVVVDNDSRDDSLLVLQRALTEHPQAELLAAPDNHGFASGNNAGLVHGERRFGRARLVWLLNPDTIVHPGGLAHLLQFLDAQPEAAIVGSRCENADGSPRRSAFRFHSILGELEAEARLGPLSKLLERHAIAPPIVEAPTRVDWVTGASMMVRREVFDRVGFLDEGFFLYYEETDFAKRAARLGLECWHVPSSRIVHACGQSTGLTGRSRERNRVPRYWFASRRRYFTKHHGRGYTALADLAWLAGALVHRVRTRGRPSDPPHRMRDFVRYNLSMWAGR